MNTLKIKISGGLGNQMFQYSVGRALSLRYHVPLELDISWFSSPMVGCTKRNFLLTAFPRIYSAEDISFYNDCHNTRWKKFLRGIASLFSPSVPVFKQPYFAYCPQIEHITPPAYLIGYWQSEKFFSSYAEDIRQDFTFPNLPNGPTIFLAQKIKATPDSVALHIRRGDYVNNLQIQSTHGNLSFKYYKKALTYIKENYGKTNIFIFSDDPNWVKENFYCYGHDKTIVDLNFPQYPYHEMHLMTLCKHHIIANSTFSWWGAWLAKQAGITIAPRKWFAQKAFDEYKDIYCKNWIIL